jgi:hypothetical protein
LLFTLSAYFNQKTAIQLIYFIILYHVFWVLFLAFSVEIKSKPLEEVVETVAPPAAPAISPRLARASDVLGAALDTHVVRASLTGMSILSAAKDHAGTPAVIPPVARYIFLFIVAELFNFSAVHNSCNIYLISYFEDRPYIPDNNHLIFVILFSSASPIPRPVAERSRRVPFSIVSMTSCVKVTPPCSPTSIVQRQSALMGPLNFAAQQSMEVNEAYHSGDSRDPLMSLVTPSVEVAHDALGDATVQWVQLFFLLRHFIIIFIIFKTVICSSSVGNLAIFVN